MPGKFRKTHDFQSISSINYHVIKRNYIRSYPQNPVSSWGITNWISRSWKKKKKKKMQSKSYPGTALTGESNIRNWNNLLKKRILPFKATFWRTHHLHRMFPKVHIPSRNLLRNYQGQKKNKNPPPPKKRKQQENIKKCSRAKTQ